MIISLQTYSLEVKKKNFHDSERIFWCRIDKPRIRLRDRFNLFWNPKSYFIFWMVYEVVVEEERINVATG